MNIDISAATEQHHEICRHGAYALYHLPGTPDFTYTAQHDAPEAVASFATLEGKQGFVAAPFHITPDTPAVLIRPDILVRHPLAAAGELHLPFAPIGRQAPGGDNAGKRKAYAAGFAVCKRHLAEGVVRKVVYARCESQPLAPDGRQSLLRLFLEACQRYPHSYVSMWYTPQSGCWLTATPETLLTADTVAPHRWHTMSLAGTMPHTPEALNIGAWSTKNKTEQALVTEFIVQQLAGIADDIRQSEVYPIPAANVVHLRTDLSFSLRNGIGLGTLLNRLHPTPAVCGTPARQRSVPSLLPKIRHAATTPASAVRCRCTVTQVSTCRSAAWNYSRTKPASTQAEACCRPAPKRPNGRKHAANCTR